VRPPTARELAPFPCGCRGGCLLCDDHGQRHPAVATVFPSDQVVGYVLAVQETAEGVLATVRWDDGADTETEVSAALLRLIS
jgi:hypothetical protein